MESCQILAAKPHLHALACWINCPAHLAFRTLKIFNTRRLAMPNDESFLAQGMGLSDYQHIIRFI